MTVTETDDIIPPRDPAAFARRRGAGINILAMAAFGLICVILGFAGAQFAKSFGKPAEPAPVVGAAPPGLEPPVQAAPVPALAGAVAPVITTAPDVSALEARVAGLEASQRRALSAAGAALAASALSESAQTSRPFEAELATLEQLLPLSADVRALRPLAESGVPSRAALAAEFDAAAARASVEARSPGENAGFLNRMIHSLSAVVTIRRVGSTVGASPDAVLARAGAQVAEGDVAGAVATLKALPPKAAQAMAGWRAKALQRIGLDHSLSTVRAQALAQLTSAPTDGLGGSQP